MSRYSLSEELKRAYPFWDALDAAERAALTDGSALRRYAKGAPVSAENGDCAGVLRVLDGELRAYITSGDGREITLYRLGGGDLCVLASCALSEISFDVAVETLRDSEVLQTSAAVFKELAANNETVENFAAKAAAEKFSDVMWTLRQILFLSADKRLAAFLWDECAKNGSVEIRLTHEQIASYMGTAREVVSRMLKYLEKEGAVELSRGTVRVNKNILRGFLPKDGV